MPPRRIPRSTSAPSRSPPPPSPPSFSSQSQPSAAAAAAAKSMGKIVHLPTRSSSVAATVAGVPPRSFASRSGLAAPPPAGPSTPRPISNPVRKRPSLSPPSDAGRPTTRQESVAPGANGSRRFLWRKDGVSVPAAVAGSTAPAQLKWKRRRHETGDNAAAASEKAENNTNHTATAADEKVDSKAKTAAEPQNKLLPPSPPKPAAETLLQEVIEPSLREEPAPTDEEVAAPPPAATPTKTLEQPADELEPTNLAAIVLEETARETVREVAVEDEVELEETEFDRMMAESDEWMRRSTAWISAALRSISSDVAKAAESEAGRAQLGALLRMSIAEVLEPVSRHAEAMGEAAAAVEEALAECKVDKVTVEEQERQQQMEVAS